MKLTTGILALAVTMTASVAYAQNAGDIDDARSVAKSLQQKQQIDTNQALDAAGTPALPDPAKPAPATSDKPTPAAPAPAIKPAVIPGSQSAPAATPKPVAAKPATSVSSTSASNQLRRVDVMQDNDTVKVEITGSQAVTPKVSKLESPARVLVELPQTADLTPKNHIAFGNAGVKGVRIGSDGKTPPTTSVVVDLDKTVPYELTPGPSGKLVLTLHTQSGAAIAKANAPAPAKSASAPQTAAKNSAPAKPQNAPAAPVATYKTVAAPVVAKVSGSAPSKDAAKDASKAKRAAPKTDAKTAVTADAKAASPFAPKAETKTEAKTEAKADDKPADKPEDKPADKADDKKWAMNGKRDPFFSPVVQQQGASGCSTGKKCLEIGNINVRGVVKSDTGFIAVVTNSLNKAYFLRENDPVFNGYVMKITGDSVVFSETVQDKLGKPFTREVVKKIFTPAV
jgi:hypothetical protein